MKKIISISLSLILFISIICNVFLIPNVMAEVDPTVAGAAIAEGDWYCSVVDFNSPSGPYWTGSGYDCYPQGENSITVNNNYGLIPYAIYTKLSNLEKNKTYTLSFNYSVQGGLDASNSGVILNKDNTYASIKWQDNRICKVNNTVYGLATDDAANKKATITFTTDENTEYILSLKANWIQSNITYSNFALDIGEASEDDGGNEDSSNKNAIANGYWRNGLTLDVNSKDNSGNLILQRGENSLTITEGYYGNWALYTCLELEPETDYEISFNYTHIEAQDSFILLDNNNSAGPVFYNPNDPQYVNPGANTIVATAIDDTENKKITFTFTTDENAKYYLVLKAKYAPGETEVFSNFEVKATEVIPDTTVTGESVAKGIWWCTVVNCFDYKQSDVYFSGSGYGYYPQGKNSITVNQDVTPWAIYTKLSGLEPNTAYEITFEYDIAGGLDASNSGVVLNEGTVPVWQDNRIDKVKNKVYGIVTDDAENKKASLYFITDENKDYFLSLKANNLGSPVVFSNFVINATPALLTDAEKAGAKVVAGNWAARYYGTVNYKNITTRTIAAVDTNYHWVIGEIEDLTVGKTYKLSFKDDYGALSSIYALPANENAIGENDAVINYNGSYTGLYRNNMQNYSSATVNEETNTVTLLFTATATKFHIFIHHAEAKTASYSGITLEEFGGITFEGATLRDDKNLCFTFNISKALQTEYEGKKVVEYGIITAVYDDLRGQPLVWNSMEAEGMARIKKAIAYSLSDNIENIYSENADGSKSFNAVISGVPENKADIEFSARPYFVLEDSTVIYGGAEIKSVEKLSKGA